MKSIRDNQPGWIYRRAIAATPLLVVGLASSCAPKITELSAIPRFVCEGDTTTLHWRVSNPFLSSTTVTTDPPSQTPRSLGSQDSVRLAIPHGMMVTVHARRPLATDTARIQVVSLPKDTSAVVAFAVRGTVIDSVTTADTTNWDPLYHVQSILSLTHWPVRIIHAGRTEVVSDSASSLAFEGLTASGAWETRLPMVATREGARPREVRLQLRLVCASNRAVQ